MADGYINFEDIAGEGCGYDFMQGRSSLRWRHVTDALSHSSYIIYTVDMHIDFAVDTDRRGIFPAINADGIISLVVAVVGRDRFAQFCCLGSRFKGIGIMSILKIFKANLRK